MAGSTRLGRATSGVTGRRSNQLNYDPFVTADCRLQNADWQCRLTIADWIGECRLAIGGVCHFAARLLPIIRPATGVRLRQGYGGTASRLFHLAKLVGGTG